MVYSLLLVLVIGIGYQGGLLLGLCKQDKKQSKFLLGLAVALLLGILGVFKYYDFFVTSFAATLSSFGLDANFATLNIVLPVGVSFYIFQTIGYLIDVYRGDTKAEEDIFDFALFVSFFPQLVAGPDLSPKNLTVEKEIFPTVLSHLFYLKNRWLNTVELSLTKGPSCREKINFS